MIKTKNLPARTQNMIDFRDYLQKSSKFFQDYRLPTSFEYPLPRLKPLSTDDAQNVKMFVLRPDMYFENSGWAVVLLGLKHLLFSKLIKFITVLDQR